MELKSISLTVKMLLITSAVSLLTWLLLDHFQADKIRAIFQQQLDERLGQLATVDRLTFDDYLRSHELAIRIIAGQDSLRNYLDSSEWPAPGEGTPPAVRNYLMEQPDWLPDPATLRSLACIHYAFLFDIETGELREVYHSRPEPPPHISAEQRGTLQRFSRGQVYLTQIGDKPFLVVSAEVGNSSNSPAALLMLASSLDSEFLVAATQRLMDPDRNVALIDNDSGRIIASDRPDLLPAGMKIDSIGNGYVVTGKSFFDGSANLKLQFASLLSRARYEDLSREVLARERRARAISAASFLMVFTVIILLIARRIGQITKEVSYSHSVIAGSPRHPGKGDELEILRNVFRSFAGEITVSREALLREKTNLEISQEELKEKNQELNRLMEMVEQRNKELAGAYDELKAVQFKILQQEKMASIGLLAAGVAHEINNPLAFVAGNLRTLRKYMERLIAYSGEQAEVIAGAGLSGPGTELEERRRSLKIDRIEGDAGDLIEESLEGADRIRAIVLNLKSFSRVDQAERKLADLHECLESTLSIAWNELKYKAEVRRDYGELPAIRCYPQQLNQVFMNLLINAAQSIEKLGEIVIRSRLEGERVTISISDNGCGISPENIGRLFEPFFTTKAAGKGTGLGLSIAYDIITKQHGGELTVSSEPGRGSVFTIKLPITPA